MFKRILIVCVGNICRSPMAEGLLRHQLYCKNLNISVSSAGLRALVDQHAAEPAQALMQMRNIDISLHRARQLTEQMVLNNDLILTMEVPHKKQILRLYPHTHGKVFLLGEWSSFEIPDPYLGTMNDYEYAMNLIDRGLEDWQKKICIR